MRPLSASWYGGLDGQRVFAEGGKDIAIKITPGTGGILQVFADGDKIYDKAEEDGQFPNLPRVKELRAVIREKLEAVPV